MLRFLTRRFLGAVVVLLIISAITFLLFFSIPADAARLACGQKCSPDQVELVRHNLGLDKSVIAQYFVFLGGLFAGRTYPTFGDCHAPCLGMSFTNHTEVTDTIIDRFPTTLTLTIGGAFFFVLIGVGLGMVAALRRGTFADKASMSVVLIAASLQIYFVGYIARFFFVDNLQILGQPRYVSPFDNPAETVAGMILPWLVLSMIFWASYARMTRSSLLESLSEDYVRTARAKGMSNLSVYFKHAWRSAMVPIITMLGVDIGSLFGGAIITEVTFTLHGFGELAKSSVDEHNLPIMLGVVITAATIILFFNIVVDALYAVLDPRVRLS